MQLVGLGNAKFDTCGGPRPRPASEKCKQIRMSLYMK